MNRRTPLLLTCLLLALCLVPGRSQGAMPYVEIYHEWHVEWDRAWVRITESDRIEEGMFVARVVPGRQVNFQAGPVHFSIPCSLDQLGAAGLLLLAVGIAGEECWRRRRRAEVRGCG